MSRDGPGMLAVDMLCTSNGITGGIDGHGCVELTC